MDIRGVWRCKDGEEQEDEEGLPRGGGDCAQGPLLYLKETKTKTSVLHLVFA